MDLATLERTCVELLRCSEHTAGAGVRERSMVALGLAFVRLDLSVEALEAIVADQRPDGSIPAGEGVGLPLVASVLRFVFHAVRLHRRELEGRLGRLVPPLEAFHERLYRGRHLHSSGPADERVVPGLAVRTGERVLEVGLNAVLIQAESDLADVAVYAGCETQQMLVRRTRRAQALARKLWREEIACFSSRDAAGWVGTPCGESLLPLYAGSALPWQARRLQERYLRPGSGFWTTRPLASLPREDPSFRAGDQGRGAVSPLLSWLMIYGLYRYGFDDLAARLNEATVALALESGLHAAYDAETGSGLGRSEDPVTASVVLSLLRAPYASQQISVF
jgi:hypothetical protein